MAVDIGGRGIRVTATSSTLRRNAPNLSPRPLRATVGSGQCLSKLSENQPWRRRWSVMISDLEASRLCSTYRRLTTSGTRSPRSRTRLASGERIA